MGGGLSRQGQGWNAVRPLALLLSPTEGVLGLSDLTVDYVIDAAIEAPSTPVLACAIVGSLPRDAFGATLQEVVLAELRQEGLGERQELTVGR